MTTVCLGIYFFIMGILHWFGNPFLVPKEYRECDWIKDYQKGITLPYIFWGIGFITWGGIFNSFQEQNTVWYCAGIIIISIIPLVLVLKNKSKFPFN